MNRIYWNIAKYYRLNNNHELANAYYQKAMELSKANRDCSTVVSYCAAFSAERLNASTYQNKQNKKTRKREWLEANKLLQANTVPESIKSWFDVEHPDADWQAKSAWK